MPKINTRSQQWYGWLPDLPDHRDLMYSAIAPALPTLPTKVDMRPKCSPVENQLSLGSCTANALAGAVEFLEIKDRTPFVDVSRLFIYYNERVIEGTVNQDSGAFIRDGIKSLAKQGVCPEKEWPYKIASFKKRPTKKCYTDAKKIRSLPIIESVRSTKCGPVWPMDSRSCSVLPCIKRSNRRRWRSRVF
jgi:hypothetical protein